MRSKILLMSLFATLFTVNSPAKAAQQINAPVVLELFTSQSCSSCPAADKIIKELAASDPSIIALSYHVDYWDYLNWKDTYSSPDNTQRQRYYAQALRSSNLFTPQLVVNGSISASGGSKREVMSAIKQAKEQPFRSSISIQPSEGKLAVNVSSLEPNTNILEIRFDRFASTDVKSGENGGRRLESINNVTSMKKLSISGNDEPILIEDIKDDSKGIAIILQKSDGSISGSATYIK